MLSISDYAFQDAKMQALVVLISDSVVPRIDGKSDRIRNQDAEIRARKSGIQGSRRDATRLAAGEKL